MFIDTTAAATVHPASTHRVPYRGVPPHLRRCSESHNAGHKTNARHKRAER
jgi:hypothetical protein